MKMIFSSTSFPQNYSGIMNHTPAGLLDGLRLDNNQGVITDYRYCEMFRIFLNTALIGLLCVLGIIGNTVSIAILRTDCQNRVAAFLLQMLAVADNSVLMMSLLVLSILYGVMPSWPDRLMPLVPYIKQYVNPFGSITQSCAVWMTVLLAINRYIAVCKPLIANLLSMRGAKLQVACVIVLSVAVNTPRFFFCESRPASTDRPFTPTPAITLDPGRWTPHAPGIPANPSTTSAPASPTMSTLQLDVRVKFELVYTVVVLILPLIVLTALNLRLIHELQAVKGRIRRFSSFYSGANENNITIIMIIIVVVLVVCHAPERVVQILRYMGGSQTASRAVCPNPLFYLVNISNLLVILNSSTNFVVYCAFRRRFRQILFWKMHSICRRSHHIAASSHQYSWTQNGGRVGTSRRQILSGNMEEMALKTGSCREVFQRRQFGTPVKIPRSRSMSPRAGSMSPLVASGRRHFTFEHCPQSSPTTPNRYPSRGRVFRGVNRTSMIEVVTAEQNQNNIRQQECRTNKIEFIKHGVILGRRPEPHSL